MLAITFFNKGPQYFNIEQRLLQKLLYFNITKYIKELMFLGFEYSFQSPLILTLESTKGYFFTSPLLRFNELLKLNYNIKEFNIITSNNVKRTNSYLHFLNLINSFNSVNSFSSALHIMANTGAKANWNQISQLIGVRGYLSNATGEFFKIPVLNSFNKGLNFFEYFISCYGARKGILDTALKTADAGYLTRRLVESAQELVIKEYNCGSNNSFEYTTYLNTNGTITLPFYLLLSGKILQKNVIEYKTKKIIEFKSSYISDYLIYNIYSKKNKYLIKLNTSSVKLCSIGRTVCSRCFGYTTFKTNYLGKSVGVLAGQVIGEPGTQLTLRTFHTGGVSSLQTSTIKHNTKFIFNYFNLFNTFKYKICAKIRTLKFNKQSNFISSIIYIKKHYFILNSLYLLFILKKYKLNQVISIQNKLIYSQNNTHLSNLLLTYLSINNIYQRKTIANNTYYFNYMGEILFKNLIQLIIKNKYNKWVFINLNKTFLLKNYFSKHFILTTEKIIIIKSKNQRYIKLSLLNNTNYLFSYREFQNKLSKLNKLSIWNILFSTNCYSFLEYSIPYNMKYIYLKTFEAFKTKINILKSKNIYKYKNVKYNIYKK